MKPNKLYVFTKLFLKRVKTALIQLYPPIIEFAGNNTQKQKRALISYIPRSINMRDNDLHLKGHSNWWECREIARILSDLGYNVDAIAHDNSTYTLSRKYDLVVDVGRNLQRIAPYLPESAKKFLLLPGAYPFYACLSETNRALDFERKTSRPTDLKHCYIPVFAIDKSLRVADACMLIGNDWTLSTYPEKYRDKTVKIQVSASDTGVVSKRYDPQKPFLKSFLFYNNHCAVWKGLDLIFEAFSRHPEWCLEICGGAEKDSAFISACAPWLEKANVKFHGFTIPCSEKFQNIINSVDAFITPSCTDGTNTSVLTCMQTGLYPIISRQTGVNLPNGCGIRLRDANNNDSELTADAVEEAVIRFLAKPVSDITDEAAKCREFTLSHHSRQAYHDSVKNFFEEHL